MRNILCIAILASLSACSLTSAVGEDVDDLCVKGRLNAAQAQFLSASPDHLNPPINENDRVIARECSELLRELTGRNE